MAQQQSTNSAASFIHEPLPYLVRIRVTQGDDSAPTIVYRQVIAYSVFEAMAQAVVQLASAAVTGQPTQYVVEDAQPDRAEWIRLRTLSHGQDPT